MAIVFETKGLIDVRAFTTMGLSAKPVSTNPIGYFGTGLKYAMAVLTRLGAQPVVWIGEDRYRFDKVSDNFRGVAYDRLRMQQIKKGWKRPRYHDLPYTTQYGRNWLPWQAFRELQSNTIDEDGTTYQALAAAVEGDPDVTKIVVDLPAFDKAYFDRDSIFLPGAQRTGRGVQIVDKETTSLFWRGLRVYETSKPCAYTYNFLDDLMLTEDRTLLGEYFARTALGRWLVQRCDDEQVIERIVTVGDTYFEHAIEYDNTLSPSAAFHRVMMRTKRANAPAWGYYSGWAPRVAGPEVPWVLFEEHPRPWAVDGDMVFDADSSTVFAKPHSYGVGDWGRTAEAVVRYINMPAGGDDEDDLRGPHADEDDNAPPPVPPTSDPLNYDDPESDDYIPPPAPRPDPVPVAVVDADDIEADPEPPLAASYRHTGDQ